MCMNMIPDDIDYTIQQMAEDLEDYVQTTVDEFWEELGRCGITDEERNKVTKKLLNAIEYLFTYSPK